MFPTLFMGKKSKLKKATNYKKNKIEKINCKKKLIVKKNSK